MERQAWQKCWKLKCRLYHWIYAAPCYKWVKNCVYIAYGEANTGCKVEIYICVTWNSIWYVVQPEKYIGWKYRFARFSENVRNETDARVTNPFRAETTPCWGDHRLSSMRPILVIFSTEFLALSTPTRHSARSNRTNSQETREQSFFGEPFYSDFSFSFCSR